MTHAFSYQSPLGSGSALKRRCVIALITVIAWAALAVPLSAAPGLAVLYEQALENDTQFHAALARYEAVRLSPNIARAQLLPQMNLRAGRTHIADQQLSGDFRDQQGSRGNETEFSYNIDELSINLTQSLFNRGYYIELRQSKSQAERAALQLQAARQDLILRLAEAYFGVLSATETLRFARSEKDAVSRQLEQARERFDVGLVPITDVKEAEAAFDLADAEEISADNQRRNALHALSVITNSDTLALKPLGATIPTPKPDPDNMQTWVDRAFAQNLDLLAQQITTNIADQEIKRQRAGHYPSLDMFAAYSENERRSGSPASGKDERSLVGVELNVPIFSGQGTRYRARQAVEQHRESLKQLEGLHRETKRMTREAYLNVVASIARVAALQRAEESAQTALESNEAGFQVGTRTSVDVLLALKDLFRTRRDYADARYEYLLNTLRLKKAAGLLSEEDIARLNGYLRDTP